MRRPGRVATLLLSGSLLMAGCATVPRDPAARAEFEANHDPLEPLNRGTFAFNLFIDRILIKPLARDYRRVLPEPGRDAIRHFLDNLNEPVIFANALLQGRLKAAGTTGCRFLLNSAAGLAGIEDVASRQKLPKQVGDFGQTLWAWGLPEGPYLILPVLGPSSPRDGIGRGVDIYVDPFRYILRRHNFSTAVSAGRAITDGIDPVSYTHLEEEGMVPEKYSKIFGDICKRTVIMRMKYLTTKESPFCIAWHMPGGSLSRHWMMTKCVRNMYYKRCKNCMPLSVRQGKKILRKSSVMS